MSGASPLFRYSAVAALRAAACRARQLVLLLALAAGFGSASIAIAAAATPPSGLGIAEKDGVLTATFVGPTTTATLSDAIPTLLARNVTAISLHGVAIEDITPLSRLTDLQALDLWGTQVRDLLPLAKLRHLRMLDLQFAPISDIGPLADLRELRSLNIGCTKVVDLTPLSNLGNLETLVVAVTAVGDLSPLQGLRQLTNLDLGSTQVSDLRPLANMLALRFLGLNGAPVDDVRPLSGMSNLRQLDLGGTQVSDIRALATLQSLASLNLEGTQVADIAPLVGLTGLQSLALGGSPAEAKASTIKLAVKPPPSEVLHAQSDSVLFWNDQANRAIAATGTDPFMASRALALESLAVLDAIRSMDGSPAVLVRLASPGDVPEDAAIAAAAHGVLVRLFPSLAPSLDAVFNNSLAGSPPGTGRDRAIAFGHAMAENIVVRRAGDGWKAVPLLRKGGAANEWRPTPPGFLPAMDPQWAKATPFMMNSPDQFRPAGPPPADSAAYGRALATVAALGAADSRERTPEQTQIAHYWNDGPGTYTPAGHWNAIAASILSSMRLGMAAEAELLAQLNVAMADASIATADAKYRFMSRRPITVLRAGDDNDPPAANWTPLIETPNHPSYISGHSSFSGAASVVLTAWLGRRPFTLASTNLPGVTRSFANFDEAAEEAAASRTYGGIHFPFDNADGLATGRAVGAWTLAAFQRDAQERGPFVMVEHDKHEATAKHPSLMGCALDNLSPLHSVVAQLDDGDAFEIKVDAGGSFLLPRQTLPGHRRLTLVATSASGRSTAIHLAVEGSDLVGMLADGDR